MNEHRVDEEWTEAMKRHYNQPPPVPRDRMWSRIDEARAARRGRRRRWLTVGSPWLPRIAAAAAMLLIGLAIGRMTTSPPAHQARQVAERPEQPATARADRTDRPTIYDLAATDLFARADLHLTGLRFASCQSGGGFETPAWAGGMLLQTRLLLDTPLVEDLSTRALLEDLELVLVQLVGLSTENCDRDLNWIREGMQEHATLERLRLAASPAVQAAL